MKFKNSGTHGIRSALAYEPRNVLREICSDFLTCMDADPSKASWFAVQHNDQNGAPNHIHLIVSSKVKNGIC